MPVKTKALAEKLAHVFRTKPVCLPETSPVSEALALMREKKIHCLMLTTAGKLSGIFTERDHVMKVIGRAKSDEPISKYMTRSPIIGRLGDTVGEAIEVMNGKGVRNLPLVGDDGTPASLVSVGALIKYLGDHFPAAVMNRPSDAVVSEQAEGG